jgi:hypothetical protein
MKRFDAIIIGTGQAEDSNSEAFHDRTTLGLYGSQFELMGDPSVINDDVVLVNAVEREFRRVLPRSDFPETRHCHQGRVRAQKPTHSMLWKPDTFRLAVHWETIRWNR